MRDRLRQDGCVDEAGGGIGCEKMVVWMDWMTERLCQDGCVDGTGCGQVVARWLCG
jgi:hypothetical protein